MVVKDYIFRKRQFYEMYTKTLVSFPSGGCVNDAVDKRTDQQGYQYDVHFLQCHAFTAVHFMNGGGVC